MGYPMTYSRLVSRNSLYPKGQFGQSAIALDLRRLEHDQRDDLHLAAYARIADITPEQAKAVLDAFFDQHDHAAFNTALADLWEQYPANRASRIFGSVIEHNRQ